MKRWKKILITVMLAAMCLAASTLTGCGCNSYRDKEVGDFVVRFYSDYCAIKGTTEQGNAQRFLVIPEYIDGVRLGSLGVHQDSIILAVQLAQPEIKSDVIEKVYFSDNTPAHVNSLDECTNLKKKLFIRGDAGILSRSSERRIYKPRKIFENDGGNQDLREWFHTVPANVSYYYNYDNADNEGYYWIDDCDYGGNIEYMPKDPVREGYTFGGWYKESDCINKWNFVMDKLPEMEETEDDEDDVYYYQETVLYAKWV